MTAKAAYVERLRGLPEWRPYLITNSGLPGPRGNIELAQAVADLGSPKLFRGYRAVDREPETPDYEKEYLVFCGVLGLGRLAAEGTKDCLATLRRYSSDPRWRVREAVAMALQHLGLADMGLLLRTAQTWSKGGRLEQRAAAAGLCEPVLLHDPARVVEVLEMLDEITASMIGATDRSTEDFRTLKKGMGYCWSVAVAALPREGKKRMERWLSSTDPDVAWIMKENLKKNRLRKMDPAWVEKQRR